jgi:hypothetical protein
VIVLHRDSLTCTSWHQHISSHLSAADHGFCDGAQHQRQDRFRESPFDTAIFILQNAAAAATWPATDGVRLELLKAMAQGKPSAAGVHRCCSYQQLSHRFVARLHLFVFNCVVMRLMSEQLLRVG